ncbi:transposable element Tcb2 transposase [Trichonephila clavipes]|nr:transposable element Tcb2 transposase [Trichonephila clavipes]
MPLRRFRRQYEQLLKFQKGRIIGMMETGWSFRRAARQIDHSDCVMRRCWDQWIREISFTRRPGSGGPRQTSRRENHHINHTKALDRRTFGIAAPITSAALTPTHRHLRLEWCRARGNWTAAEWNQVVFSDESRFNLSSDNNRVLRPRGERLNPAFALCHKPLPQLV